MAYGHHKIKNRIVRLRGILTWKGGPSVDVQLVTVSCCMTNITKQGLGVDYRTNSWGLPSGKLT